MNDIEIEELEVTKPPFEVAEQNAKYLHSTLLDVLSNIELTKVDGDKAHIWDKVSAPMTIFDQIVDAMNAEAKRELGDIDAKS